MAFAAATAAVASLMMPVFQHTGVHMRPLHNLQARVALIGTIAWNDLHWVLGRVVSCGGSDAARLRAYTDLIGLELKSRVNLMAAASCLRCAAVTGPVRTQG